MALVDASPLLAVTDGVILSSQLEGVVLVVNGSNCRAETIRTATLYLEKWVLQYWATFGTVDNLGYSGITPRLDDTTGGPSRNHWADPH